MSAAVEPDDADWTYSEETAVLYGPDPDNPRLRYPFATQVEPVIGRRLAALLNRQPDEADVEACGYGHTEAQHEAVGACERPSLEARAASSRAGVPVGPRRIGWEQGWDAARAALAAVQTADRRRVQAVEAPVYALGDLLSDVDPETIDASYLFRRVLGIHARLCVALWGGGR